MRALGCIIYPAHTAHGWVYGVSQPHLWNLLFRYTADDGFGNLIHSPRYKRVIRKEEH